MVQPPNVDVPIGDTDRSGATPAGNVAVHAPGQSMPAGVETTRPAPSPTNCMVNVKGVVDECGGPGGGSEGGSAGGVGLPGAPGDAATAAFDGP